MKDEPMQYPQNSDPSLYRWAGVDAAPPRTSDSFPTRDFYRWVLVGLAGFALMFGLYLYLEHRASRQIIYLTHDNAIGMVRADGTGDRKLNFTGLTYSAIGQPQWSPQGGRFASIIDTPSGTVLVIINRADQLVARIPLQASIASELLPLAWAPGGDHVAIISQRTGSSEIQIADLTQQQIQPLVQTLSDRRVSWHPQRDQLLVTTLSEQSNETIQIVSVNAQATVFNPEDGFTHRKQATWSPNGDQIAYIASNSPDSADQLLFVANTDTSSPTKIVANGQNFLPIWAPRGDLIIFTRYNSETNEFLLYRVRPNGEDLAIIGRGLPPDIAMNDARNGISWSPDGDHMIFQSFNPNTGQINLLLADYDGSNSSSLVSNLATIGVHPRAMWSPTNRAVLVASDGDIWMRWLNREEREIFVRGLFPNWEP